MNVLDLSEVDFFCQMMNCYDKECGASEYSCNDDYLKFTKDNKALFQNKNVDNTLVCNIYIQIKLILTLVTLYFQQFIVSRGLRYCRASPHAFTYYKYSNKQKLFNQCPERASFSHSDVHSHCVAFYNPAPKERGFSIVVNPRKEKYSVLLMSIIMTLMGFFVFIFNTNTAIPFIHTLVHMCKR